MERLSVTGLLAVCLLLAAGLSLTTVLNYRATSLAARDVLYSQASQTARSFAASARLTGAQADRQQLQQLVTEMSAEGLGLVVINRRGEALAAARGGKPRGTEGLKLPATVTIVKGLRVQGEYHRLVQGTDPYLELWQPLRPRRGWRGRRSWGWGQKRSWPAAGQGGVRPAAGRDHGGRGLLVGVSVPLSSADSLVGPARNTMIVAGVASVVLLLLGVLLYRGARRARDAERQLQHQRALSALGEMAAIMAHEIRTPLAAVKGNAQLLAESSADEELCGSIVREASRLERLVNGLLDYARPSEPNRTRCDGNELADRAAEIVAPRALAAGVNLVTDPAIEEGPVTLQADPDKVLQVLVNLLQNAVEAGADPAAGGTTVTISVRPRGKQVLFTVLDQGPGLGDRDPEEILRPFFTSKKQGTGLGLSIAQRVVQQHGGQLTLQGRDDGGTAARVLI